MANIEVKDVSGKKVEVRDLNAGVFGIEPNVHVMHQVVRAQRASWRQGTHDTLTRGQVRGGGKKPWRQKGTGRARQGSIRSPQWRGGGTVFGPHPRSYAFRVNNKEVKLAMRSALSAKLADGELFVVDSFGFEEPKTKSAAAALKALGITGRTTLVIGNEDVNTYLAFRNLPNVEVIPVMAGNTYDFVNNKALIFTAEALSRIEEVLA
ncbi:LSU ribosomal protein L4P [Cryptobacterium curtum DSM 15641]|uniref:Large ribosomal subunit protein uL4 n=1 Tax=Cryptobacterium curtum (strain ATCC 700683 / DSM 15641 / CCUG 43107 / 12-3) TaxID=469378 RepID=C7MP52_CRYCD|nr:50S ribosomal protein L4 [Cryptobacterium curtum]ACU94692.1 LSU ribosomal protein L4P [Cryptobacterium curtum DSM 15641]